MEDRTNLIDTLDVNHVVETLDKIGRFQAAVQKSMKEGVDFGIIPGKDKPTLLKPGAEKILMAMGLTSEYAIADKASDDEKGRYSFTVKCSLSRNGQKITEGIGHCDTREYSSVNTCLKVAKKRAQIDACLSAASLSEVFTQDIEDIETAGGLNSTINSTIDEAGHGEDNDVINKVPEGDGAPDDSARDGVVLSFGRHKGRTLNEVNESDPGYIDWLSSNARDEEVRNVSKGLIESRR